MEDNILNKYIEEYSEDVKNIARKYYISDGSSDDLFQEGLIGLVEGYNIFDTKFGEVGSPAFKSFLLMCAKRQILDAVKKSNSKRNLPMTNFISMSGDDFIEISRLTESQESLEDSIIDKISSEVDTITAVSLSEFERLVLDYYLDGLKQAEIAELLDKPVKSIDNTIQRIKSKLKRNA